MSNQKEAQFSKPVKAAILYAVLGMLPSMVSIFTLPIYLQHLSVADYGTLSLLLFFGNFFGMVACLQLNAGASVTYFDYNLAINDLKEFQSTIFTSVIVVSILNFILFAIVGKLFFSSFLTSSSVTFEKEGLIVMATAMLSQLQIIYLMYQRNAYQLKVCMRYSLASLSLGVAFQYFLIVERDMGVTGSVLGSLLSTSFIVGYLLLSQRHLINFKVNRSILKPTLRLSVPLIPLIFLEWFYSAGARLFVEKLMTLADVGRISLIITFMLVTNKLFNSIWSGFSPELFRMLKSEESVNYGRMHDIVSAHVRIGLLVISGTLMLGCNLALLTSNEKYLQIIPLLPLASLSMIPKMLTSVPSLKLMSEKKSKMILIIMSISTAILLVGFVLMVPHSGLMGILISFLIANLINFMIRSWKSWGFSKAVLFTHKQLYWIITVLGLIVITHQLRSISGLSYELFGLTQFIIVLIFLTFISRKELTLTLMRLRPALQTIRSAYSNKSSQ